MPIMAERMHSAGPAICEGRMSSRLFTITGLHSTILESLLDRPLFLHAMLFILRAQDAVHGVRGAMGRLMEVAHLHFAQQAQG